MLTFQHKPTWTPSKLTLRLPGNKNLHFLYCKKYLVQLHLEVITNPQSINFLNLPLLPVLLISQWVIFSPQQSPAELQRRSHWSGAGFKEGKASLRTGAGKSKRLFPLSYSGEWKTVGDLTISTWWNVPGEFGQLHMELWLRVRVSKSNFGEHTGEKGFGAWQGLKLELGLGLQHLGAMFSVKHQINSKIRDETIAGRYCFIFCCRRGSCSLIWY